jgi:hypothetical protein
MAVPVKKTAARIAEAKRAAASYVRSDRANVLRLGALLALSDLELDPLVLVKTPVTACRDRGEVRENVGAAIIGRDEAEAFFRVEPLNSAYSHVPSLLTWIRNSRIRLAAVRKHGNGK